MDRKLTDYLPYVIRDYDVMQELMNAEQPEFERAWSTAENVLDNQFITTADDLGLSRWEKILGIIPKGTDSLLERRFRVLARCSEELPYTLRRLRNILETLCGTGNSWANIEENSYLLRVGVALDAVGNFEDVLAMLERVTPVNLIFYVLLDVKTWPIPVSVGHWMHTGDYITLGKVTLEV